MWLCQLWSHCHSAPQPVLLSVPGLRSPHFCLASWLTLGCCPEDCQRETRGLEGKEGISYLSLLPGGVRLAPCSMGVHLTGCTNTKQQLLSLTAINFGFSTTYRICLIKFPSDTSTSMYPTGTSRIHSLSCSVGTPRWISQRSSKFQDNRSPPGLRGGVETALLCLPCKSKWLFILFSEGIWKEHINIYLWPCYLAGLIEGRHILPHVCNLSNLSVKITWVHGFMSKPTW